MQDNVGRRLENFFWRIWSSRQVQDRLSGQQVAAQFKAINEGGYIRTTPRSSPRSSRSLSSYYSPATSYQDSFTSDDKSEPSTPPSTSDTGRDGQSTVPFAKRNLQPKTGQSSLTGLKASPGQELDEDGTATPTPSSPFGSTRATSIPSKANRRSLEPKPVPILKKADSGESRKPQKSAVISLPSLDCSASTSSQAEESALASDDDTPPQRQTSELTGSPPARKYTATRFSEEVSVSIPKNTSRNSARRSQGEASQTTSRRTPVVVASTAASKRKPGLIRQRSSQSSHTKPLPSPPSSGFRRRSAAATPVTGQSPSKSGFSGIKKRSPSSSEEDQSSDKIRTDGLEMNYASVSRKKTTNQIPSIDPEPQPALAARVQPQHRSFTNLSALDRKSSAVTAAAASYQASGLLDYGQPPAGFGRGSGRDAFRNEIVPLKAPAPAAPGDSDSEPRISLPRTKSQLALLLERGTGFNDRQRPN